MRAALVCLIAFALWCASATVYGQPADGDGESTSEAADGAVAEDGEGGGAAEASVPPPKPEVSPYMLHMNNGIRLFKAGLWDGAIAEFQAAYDAEPKASPLINLALTYKKMADPVKAIEVLEMSLRKHRDSMPSDQLAAAHREIKEMKALLAYVKVTVKPALETLELIVDDEAYPDFKDGAELVLAPGIRSFRVRAPGYAEGEARVQIVSGKDNPPVTLEMRPTHGEVIITAHHTDAWIEVDGAKKTKGFHREMLPPGVHVIRVIRAEAVDAIQIVVQAGERYAVTQDDDGELESDATAPLEQPEPEEPEGFGPNIPKFLRGFYGLGEAAFLTAFANVPTVELKNDDRFGVAVGLRLGYRVTDWAAFEGMSQYSDIRVSGNLKTPAVDLEGNPQGPREMTFVLKTLRLGGALRVMLPGKSWVRFVGNIGGGIVVEDLEWRGEPVLTDLYVDESGVGPFGQLDVGIEFEFQRVLIDALLQTMLQGTKHFDLESDQNVFETQPTVILGPALRVGYALW
jgi:hypothetical protein